MTETMNQRLEPYHIHDAPPSMYYISDFITVEEEEYILNKIPSNQWISLSHRRLQAIPARLTENNALIASTGLPDWVKKPIVDGFKDLGIFNDSPHGSVNHCLVNEYLPGQGIMPHEDGAAYHPAVATVSLDGSLVLEVSEKSSHEDVNDERKAWRIFQEPRSLLVTTGAAYKDTLHGIAEVIEDMNLNENSVANWTLLGDRDRIVTNGGRNERTTRISLTYRDVLRESKVASKLFGKPKT